MWSMSIANDRHKKRYSEGSSMFKEACLVLANNVEFQCSKHTGPKVMGQNPHVAPRSCSKRLIR